MTDFLVTFRGVPLIPPIDCFDPKSWIAERIYEMGANDARAAQWAADQELEACCEWLEQKGFAFVDEIRAARRPKPPSLKEQALKELA